MVPYSGFPTKNKEFVQKLAERAGAASDLGTSWMYLLSAIGDFQDFGHRAGLLGMRKWCL